MGGLQEWKKRAIQPPAEKGAGLEQTVRKPVSYTHLTLPTT